MKVFLVSQGSANWGKATTPNFKFAPAQLPLALASGSLIKNEDRL